MNKKVLSDCQNYYSKQSSQPTYFDGPKISWILEVGRAHFFWPGPSRAKKIRIGYVLKSADVGTLFSRRNSENSSHTHVYTHAYPRTHQCTPAHTCVLPHIPTHTRPHPRTRAHSRIPAHTHAHLCTPAHTRAHPHTPTDTCTHPTHTH